MTFISIKESLTLLEQGLNDAWDKYGRPTSVWVAATCPAPNSVAASLVDLDVSPHRVYWASGDEADDSPESSPHLPRSSLARGSESFGIGVAGLVQLNGGERFERARALIEESYAQLDCEETLRPQLRFFGGTSFSPERSATEPSWKQFGDAHFLLPRILYQSDQDGARLICLAERDRIAESLALARVVLEAAEAAPLPDPAPLDTVGRQDSSPPSAWHSLIEAIQSSIKDGSLEKVVAARCVKLQVSQSPRLSTVMRRLALIAPRCARFALRIGDQSFVGATPERLVRRRGRSVETEALAGSIDARALNAASTLLKSEKDRHEHAFVVEAIERSLAPLCETLELPNEPDVRTLRDILHLRTPILGTLKKDVHVLTLVDRLHPTPAVGGLPQGKALNWILEHEEAERGWYAAPIGWLDACGDGEFFVALRSALISNKSIQVYAGAGIVAESDPDEEYAETELKLSGMLSALGLAS